MEIKSVRSKITTCKSIQIRPNFICSSENAFPELDYLCLGGNKLTTYPGSLSKLTKLTKLDIANSGLASFPDFIDNLSNLMVLYIGGNPVANNVDEINKLKQRLPNLVIHFKRMYLLFLERSLSMMNLLYSMMRCKE